MYRPIIIVISLVLFSCSSNYNQSREINFATQGDKVVLRFINENGNNYKINITTYSKNKELKSKFFDDNEIEAITDYSGGEDPPLVETKDLSSSEKIIALVMSAGASTDQVYTIFYITPNTIELIYNENAAEFFIFNKRLNNKKLLIIKNLIYYGDWAYKYKALAWNGNTYSLNQSASREYNYYRYIELRDSTTKKAEDDASIEMLLCLFSAGKYNELKDLYYKNEEWIRSVYSIKKKEMTFEIFIEELGKI